LAAEKQIKTIAFPAISTGAYGFPVQRVAEIAFFEIQSFLSKNALIEKITQVCFDPTTFKVYRTVFQLK
jgi:O-acetyl-ADP-ribose deacetylase (regulator of RNase III)